MAAAGDGCASPDDAGATAGPAALAAATDCNQDEEQTPANQHDETVNYTGRTHSKTRLVPPLLAAAEDDPSPRAGSLSEYQLQAMAAPLQTMQVPQLVQLRWGLHRKTAHRKKKKRSTTMSL